jgi:hypothetical protein
MNPGAHIGITGGTGFVGRHLSALLVGAGYKVTILGRKALPEAGNPKLGYAQWDATKGIVDAAALGQLDALVHLAGAGIADKRWTAARKQEIYDSRILGTRFLVEQLRLHAPKCKQLVAASAIGWYGEDRAGDPAFTEEAPAAKDFLGTTCQAWEAETLKAAASMRTTLLRFGIVLGKESGAYPKLVQPLRFGVAPILGSGKQIISWVHVADLCHMIVFSLEHELQGVYNAVAPKPVSNRQLMQTLQQVRGGFSIAVPVPAFALELLMGEMSIEVLKSCTASARKIEDAGFKFSYADIVGAVQELSS